MKLRVEVVWALPARQRVVSLELEEGATARDAVQASGLRTTYAALGRFGKKIAPGTVLRDGDRVELLRPLAADPKEARRQRARRR
jgi:putative ubiquitin-RnfH superfamily antitoxin RatB of RatAB toxin-antitoxin module